MILYMIREFNMFLINHSINSLKTVRLKSFDKFIFLTIKIYPNIFISFEKFYNFKYF